MFTFKKIDGSSASFLIHFYFLNEDGDQRRFYGSARDVTEKTNLHWHMELLSRFTSRTVIFLLYSQGQYSFEVPAHGLEKDMGLSRQELEKELNDGAILSVAVDADYVNDELGDVKCILSLRKK
ncbi:MAG: hypothetical protein IJI25_05710 [Eubacterium sp.]|nr:hypothetical protein [Eubacterium sp.]